MSEETNKKYIEATTKALINEYRDLIKKTFEVVDKDLLQEKIDKEDMTGESEDKYLNSIKKRRVALDEVDIMLDKIAKLESRLNPKGEEEGSAQSSAHKKFVRED